MTSIYEYTIEGIDGTAINFADFKGKKILVVNVASECGYTKQYEQLQELTTHFKDELVILGVPCNQFGGQESGSNEAIQNFCSTRFAVTFPLTTKVDVIGEQQHKIYQWLTQKSLNGQQDSTISWNFQKYLMDEQGVLIHVFPSSVDPLSEVLLNAIG